MSRPSKETLALRQRVKELEAQVIGCEQAVRLADQDLRAARAELGRVEEENVEASRTILRLSREVEQQVRDVLSDAELVGLAAEVQAELTAVPPTAARRRLQVALRARGVLERPAQWQASNRFDAAGPSFVLKKVAEKP